MFWLLLAVLCPIHLFGITVHYQQHATTIVPRATITQNGVTIPVYEGDMTTLEALNITLADVPPPHLTLLLRRQPDG